MVVSAILLTALAPITGALFGASYGTSIRIGYEIIFPALFGDMINKQKNGKLDTSNAKTTIKALHTMFTATGGVSAMEFGIEQGIELAKKKTESQDVQDMIDLNLGLSDRQINKRGKSFQFQDPITDKPTFPDVEDFTVIGDIGDFAHQTNIQITEFFKKFKIRGNFDQAFKLLVREKGNTSFTQQIWTRYRPAASSTTIEAIEKSATGSIKDIAIQFNEVSAILRGMRTQKKALGSKWLQTSQYNSMRSQFFIKVKKYNRLVQSLRKPKLSIDSAKSLSAMRIIPKT